MFRPRLLLTSLAIALGACSPQDPQATTLENLGRDFPYSRLSGLPSLRQQRS